MKIAQQTLIGILLFFFGFRLAVLVFRNATNPILCIDQMLSVSGYFTVAGLALLLILLIAELIRPLDGTHEHKKTGNVSDFTAFKD